MDDKIKYLLMAVGAYFLYDWYTGQVATPTTPAPGGSTSPADLVDVGIAPAPAATPPVPVTPLPPWTAPVYTPPPQTAAVALAARSVSDEGTAIAAAAFNQDAVTESVRRGQKYNFHQWNYFREITKGVQPEPGSYFGGDPNTRVTAAEYMLVRATAVATGVVQGMTGLGWAPTLPWSTAWSA